MALPPCRSQYNIPVKHYTLPIIVERDAEGFYVSCPQLQGCYSQASTYDEALSNIKDAIRMQLEHRQADHDELAEPKSFGLSTVEISVLERATSNSSIEDPLLSLRGSVQASLA